MNSSPEKTNPGKIQCILGPMYSGKTTELHMRVRRYRIAKKKTLMIKFKGDIRDIRPLNSRIHQVSVVTHDGYEEEAVECGQKLVALLPLSERYDVIGIDEGQFFDDLADFSEMLANNGKMVIISALDGDKNRNMWPSIGELLPKCDTFEKLTSVCMTCGKKAPFTFREGEELILIGAKNEGYEACCRHCYAIKSIRISIANEREDDKEP